MFQDTTAVYRVTQTTHLARLSAGFLARLFRTTLSIPHRPTPRTPPRTTLRTSSRVLPRPQTRQPHHNPHHGPPLTHIMANQTTIRATNPTPCYVCEQTHTRRPHIHASLQTVGGGLKSGVCEINHETYCRRHPWKTGIYPTVREALLGTFIVSLLC